MTSPLSFGAAAPVGRALRARRPAFPFFFALALACSFIFAASAPLAHAAFDLNKALNTAKSLGKVAKGVTGIGPEEELAIGESVSLEIIAQYGGLVRDETATRRLNLIGRSLAYYSSRPALEWKFGLLDSPSFNGFSAPGGFVFITRGLYELCGDNDDALAAVLAHEIAHITGKHALNIIARGEFVSGAADFAALRSSDVAKAQAQLSAFDTSIGNLVKTILEQGFDPQTEFGADQSGRDLALTVGYAPGALRSVLTRLQQRTGPSVAVFSTHPPLDQRIARLPDEPASSAPRESVADALAPANLDEDDAAFAATAADDEAFQKKKK
jgi:Putative Zn-dependent protease, contains TPR repeats